MKRHIVGILLAIGAAVLCNQAPVDAQCGTVGPVCATRTTLAANAAATDQFITVTSNTGFTVGNMLWIDFEQMRITAISGTRITVIRGVNGTSAQAHDNTDGVITGAENHFHTNPPDFGSDCTRGAGQAAYSPWIDVRTGWVWTCDAFSATGEWRATQKPQKDDNSEPTTF